MCLDGGSGSRLAASIWQGRKWRFARSMALRCPHGFTCGGDPARYCTCPPPVGFWYPTSARCDSSASTHLVEHAHHTTYSDAGWCDHGFSGHRFRGYLALEYAMNQYIIIMLSSSKSILEAGKKGE